RFHRSASLHDHKAEGFPARRRNAPTFPQAPLRGSNVGRGLATLRVPALPDYGSLLTKGLVQSVVRGKVATSNDEAVHLRAPKSRTVSTVRRDRPSRCAAVVINV